MTDSTSSVAGRGRAKHRTLLGTCTYAIGGNPETAFAYGAPVRRVLIFLHTLSGMAAAP